eukprot:5028186-Amphidinium_carterae.1
MERIPRARGPLDPDIPNVPTEAAQKAAGRAAKAARLDGEGSGLLSGLRTPAPGTAVPGTAIPGTAIPGTANPGAPQAEARMELQRSSSVTHLVAKA